MPGKQQVTFRAPWLNRLRLAERRGVLPINTRHQLAEAITHQTVDEQIRAMLEMSIAQASKMWRKNWTNLSAVGPFTTDRRPWSIPFVLYGDIRRIDQNLHAMCTALIPAYQEFGILPDIFLYPMHFVRELQAADDPNWLLTRRYSLTLRGEDA